MNPSQYRLASELVELIHEDFQGFHPGYRGVMPRLVIILRYLRPRQRQRSCAYCYYVL